MKTHLLRSQIKTLPSHSLKSWVIQTALGSDDPVGWLGDVGRQGCVSGIVSELIYYTDTATFYDRFSDEIWEMAMDFCDNTGQKLGEFLDGFSVPISDDVTFKNALAWFSVEETANQLLLEIGDDDW